MAATNFERRSIGRGLSMRDDCELLQRIDSIYFICKIQTANSSAFISENIVSAISKQRGTISEHAGYYR